MNRIVIFFLKVSRKLYTHLLEKKLIQIERNYDKAIASNTIYNLLISKDPCMIARIGATELMTIVNYIGVKNCNKSILNYIKGDSLQWWWNSNIIEQMQCWSGFFPPTQNKIEQFCELMLKDIPDVDVLGSWLPEETYLKDKLQKAFITDLILLEPFFQKEPWTIALEHKRVLVVHPFAELIEKQYHENRTKLFKNPHILPEFQLETIKAVQSLGGENNGFTDWFEALRWMENEIDTKDYDICLLGCGAYGFPLAAHIKRQGKKAFHLGGVLQLLFGIRGKRWEDPNYGVKEWGIPYGAYSSLINDYWVRANESYKPKNFKQVEGSTYW